MIYKFTTINGKNIIQKLDTTEGTCDYIRNKYLACGPDEAGTKDDYIRCLLNHSGCTVTIRAIRESTIFMFGQNLSNEIKIIAPMSDNLKNIVIQTSGVLVTARINNLYGITAFSDYVNELKDKIDKYYN